MKKILLVVPPMVSAIGVMRRLTEPLAILSIGSYLIDKGYDVESFDMPCEGYDNLRNAIIKNGRKKEEVCIYGSDWHELSEKIKDRKPDIIGFSCIYTFQKEIFFDLCNYVKDEFPEIPLFVGGNAAICEPEEFLKKSKVDYIILGEGELRIEKLLCNLSNGKNPVDGMEGVAYRKNDEITILPSEGFIKSLDIVPIMRREIINQEKYIAIDRPQAPFCMGKRVSTVLVSKGCTQRCTFCNNPMMTGNKFRKRSVENIVNEIKYLKEKYRVDEIQFFSESLTADRKYAKELFKQLIPLNIYWCAPTGLYFNSIDEEMLDLMKESGCYQITIAIESASQRVLKDLMRKNVQLERVKKIVDYAHSLNIAVHGFFIIGMPGETREEIGETLKFPFDNNFDSISLGIVNALAGSELYNTCKEKGYLTPGEDSFSVNSGDSTNIVIPEDSQDYAYSREELEELVSKTLETHYNWSKDEFPDLWKRRYGRYLEKFPEEAEVLTKRI